jgi:hypothetical protein
MRPGRPGSFGAERRHYEISVEVAEPELLPAVREAGEGATMLSDGFSCRTQLRQLAHRDGIHLAELLARSIEDGPGARRYPR